MTLEDEIKSEEKIEVVCSRGTQVSTVSTICMRPILPIDNLDFDYQSDQVT